MSTIDDPKVKDLGDSTGNSTKDPEPQDVEDSMEASIGKAGQKGTKVVKIKGNPEKEDDDALVSPEERQAKAWAINMGKNLLADAEDDEDTTRKVNFEFVKQMEVDRAQRERKRVEKSVKAKVITNC